MNTVQIGSDEQFALLRRTLQDSSFTEAEVCRRFGLERYELFESAEDREQVSPFDADATGVLIRLFIEGRYVEAATLEAKLGQDCLAALAALGLLEHHPADENQIAARVALYPIAGVWVISDRWNNPDRSPFNPGADVVYPAIVSTAQRFLRLMPARKSKRMLDLCSGTAVAALRATKEYAAKAWAFDIAEKSTRFGEFNAKLNGIDNLATVTGDLYQPAGSLQFDYIVAHPPYVPVLRPKWIYHDGGEDGEQIMRGVVAGLDKHLEPGGLLYMMATGSDRDQPFEQRIREWLGSSQGEFDVAIFPVRIFEPEDFIVRTVIKSPSPEADAKRFIQLFKELRYQSMVYAAILIQRHDQPRQSFTIRRQIPSSAGPADMMRILEWETGAAAPYGSEFVLDSRIRSNPTVAMRVMHKLTEEGWEVSSYQLQQTHPFAMEAAIDPWAAHLMSLADGNFTVRELFATMKEQQIFPEEAPEQEFAAAVARLVSGGFFQVEVPAC